MLDTLIVHVPDFRLPLYKTGRRARDGERVDEHDQHTGTSPGQVDGLTP